MKIKIGTRGSKLALVQTEIVKNSLQRLYPTMAFEVEIIKTTGDKILDSPLSKIGDKGLFTREIEKELLAGNIDLAVHSMKDMPTSLPAGLEIGAITEREDPHDVFIARNKNTLLEDLRDGDIIATSSLRRRAQLLSYNPFLKIVDIRGSVQTRIEKMENNVDIQGIVLAYAGVKRVGLDDWISEIIPETVMLPAVGQASLAVEISQNNETIKELIWPLNHEQTAVEIKCERCFMKILEGGCQVPVGGYARLRNGTLTLVGMVASLDGKQVFRQTVSGQAHEYATIAEKLATDILKAGAREILNNIYRSAR